MKQEEAKELKLNGQTAKPAAVGWTHGYSVLHFAIRGVLRSISLVIAIRSSLKG
jgi:hypothetical protein